jgi:beta-glucosidase
METDRMADQGSQFPRDFLWGTATAAYQIEGASAEDGRGASVWDVFSDQPGRVANGDTGDVACDHYHRWPEDIALMHALGLKAYRFSIAWARIFPEGRGQANPRGLAWYSRLVDGLLEAGIRPFVTLYHWDLPQAFQDLRDAGGPGWQRRAIADDFAAYAETVVGHLGDRVKDWITINEPWVFTWLGEFFGGHAPGHDTRPLAHPDRYAAVLRASHHVLMAHGRAVQAVRAAQPDARVGITCVLTPTEPRDPASAADRAAAVRYDGLFNRWYLDAVFRGEYPTDMTDLFGAAAPTASGTAQPGDMALIAQPIDFLGVNYYFRSIIEDAADAAPDVRAAVALDARQHTPTPSDAAPDVENTAMGWEVYPDGLYTILTRVHADYAPKAVYITENGAAFDDTVTHDPDGAPRVHDPRRVAYLRAHFAAAARAIAAGVPLRGYFVWSLLDNFEWAEGYAKRFGIHYVDYPTGTRIAKDSARYLGAVAAETAASGL